MLKHKKTPTLIITLLSVLKLCAQTFSGEDGHLSWEMSICRYDSMQVYLYITVQNTSTDTIFLSETNANYISTYLEGNSTRVSIGWDTEYAEKNLNMKPLAPKMYFYFYKILPEMSVSKIFLSSSYIISNKNHILYGQKHLIEGKYASFEFKLLPEMIKEIIYCVK